MRREFKWSPSARSVYPTPSSFRPFGASLSHPTPSYAPKRLIHSASPRAEITPPSTWRSKSRPALLGSVGRKILSPFFFFFFFFRLSSLHQSSCSILFACSHVLSCSFSLFFINFIHPKTHNLFPNLWSKSSFRFVGGTASAFVLFSSCQSKSLISPVINSELFPTLIDLLIYFFS